MRGKIWFIGPGETGYGRASVQGLICLAPARTPSVMRTVIWPSPASSTMAAGGKGMPLMGTRTNRPLCRPAQVSVVGVGLAGVGGVLAGVGAGLAAWGGLAAGSGLAGWPA